MSGFGDWCDRTMRQPPLKRGEPYPMFNRISIETCSSCTRACSFCPQQFRDAGVQLMDDKLYERIIKQLYGLEFAGVVQWFYLNEPLMDRKRYERIKMLPPRCCVHLTSNGDTLRTYERFVDECLKLFSAGVNSLNFNAYDDKGMRFKDWVKQFNVRYISRTGPHNWRYVRGRYISWDDRRDPDNLHSWSGRFDGDKYIKKFNKRCARPHRHIVVQWDGQAPLCCAQDPTRESFESMGDFNSQSLVDVWNSPGFHKHRFQLQNAQRSGQCIDCNEITAYPHVIRKVEE